MCNYSSISHLTECSLFRQILNSTCCCILLFPLFLWLLVYLLMFVLLLQPVSFGCFQLSRDMVFILLISSLLFSKLNTLLFFFMTERSFPGKLGPLPPKLTKSGSFKGGQRMLSLGESYVILLLNLPIGVLPRVTLKVSHIFLSVWFGVHLGLTISCVRDGAGNDPLSGVLPTVENDDSLLLTHSRLHFSGPRATTKSSELCKYGPLLVPTPFSLARANHHPQCAQFQSQCHSEVLCWHPTSLQPCRPPPSNCYRCLHFRTGCLDLLMSLPSKLVETC